MFVAIAAPNAAAASESAVELHAPDLPAAATVWCLDNPGTFAVSARAVGLAVGERPKAELFDRPAGQAIGLEEWAAGSDEQDIRDFDAACLPAYEAFSPSGGSGGVSDEDWFGLVTALLGALTGGGIAIGGSVGLERLSSHRQDADRLVQLSRELSAAIGNLAGDATAENVDRAAGHAHALRIALNEWRAYEPSAAKRAEDLLAELLGGGTPSIANPTGSDPQAETIREQATEISGYVAEVATEVSRLKRSPDPESVRL